MCFPILLCFVFLIAFCVYFDYLKLIYLETFFYVGFVALFIFMFEQTISSEIVI